MKTSIVLLVGAVASSVLGVPAINSAQASNQKLETKIAFPLPCEVKTAGYGDQRKDSTGNWGPSNYFVVQAYTVSDQGKLIRTFLRDADGEAFFQNEADAGALKMRYQAIGLCK